MLRDKSFLLLTFEGIISLGLFPISPYSLLILVRFYLHVYVGSRGLVGLLILLDWNSPSWLISFTSNRLLASTDRNNLLGQLPSINCCYRLSRLMIFGSLFVPISVISRVFLRNFIGGSGKTGLTEGRLYFGTNGFVSLLLLNSVHCG